MTNLKAGSGPTSEPVQGPHSHLGRCTVVLLTDFLWTPNRHSHHRHHHHHRRRRQICKSGSYILKGKSEGWQLKPRALLPTIKQLKQARKGEVSWTLEHSSRGRSSWDNATLSSQKNTTRDSPPPKGERIQEVYMQSSMRAWLLTGMT